MELINYKTLTRSRICRMFEKVKFYLKFFFVTFHFHKIQKLNKDLIHSNLQLLSDFFCIVVTKLNVYACQYL